MGYTYFLVRVNDSPAFASGKLESKLGGLMGNFSLPVTIGRLSNLDNPGENPVASKAEKLLTLNGKSPKTPVPLRGLETCPEVMLL